MKGASAISKCSSPKLVTAAIDTAAKKLQMDTALNILANLRAHHRLNTVAVNTVIAASGRCNSWALAVSLVRDLELCSLCLTVITLNSLLSSLQRGFVWQRALVTFANGIVDQITFNVLIKTCSQLLRWQAAHAVASSMRACTVEPDRYTCSALLSEKGWKVAFEILNFGPVKIDAACYNASVGLAGRLGDWERSLQLVSWMCATEVRTDMRCFNELYSCLDAGRWRLVLLGLYGGNQGRPDIVRLNSAIDTCSKVRQWLVAVDVFAGVRIAGLQADIVGSNCLILAVKHRWQEAITLPATMTGHRIWPDEASYSAAFSACHPRPQAIDWLMWQMSRQSLQHSATTCGSAINACEPAGCWQLAIWILGKAVQDEICYGATISVCEKAQRWNAALQLVHGLRSGKDMQLDAVSISAVISACGTSHVWQTPLELFARMAEQRLAQNQISYSSAAAACKAGMAWQIALQLMDRMRRLDITCRSIILGICETHVDSLLDRIPSLLAGIAHESPRTLHMHLTKSWREQIGWSYLEGQRDVVNRLVIRRMGLLFGF